MKWKELTLLRSRRGMSSRYLLLCRYLQVDPFLIKRVRWPCRMRMVSNQRAFMKWIKKLLTAMIWKITTMRIWTSRWIWITIKIKMIRSPKIWKDRKKVSSSSQKERYQLMLMELIRHWIIHSFLKSRRWLCHKDLAIGILSSLTCLKRRTKILKPRFQERRSDEIETYSR